MKPVPYKIPYGYKYNKFTEMTPSPEILTALYEEYVPLIQSTFQHVIDGLRSITIEQFQNLVQGNGYSDFEFDTNDKNIRNRLIYRPIRIIVDSFFNNLNINFILADLVNYVKYKQYYISDEQQAEIVNLYNDILSYLGSYGFIFKYYIFIKENSYMYQLNVNNVRLEYDIAASGMTILAPPIIYGSTFRRIQATFTRTQVDAIDIRRAAQINNDEEHFGITYEDKHGNSFIGWKRSELIAALKESEVFKEEVTEINPGKYIYSYPNLGKAIMHIRKKRELPIFDLLSKVKLEYLYQYINSQRAGGNQFNFQKLCRMQVDRETMDRMLKKFLPSLEPIFKDLSVLEICKELSVHKQAMVFIPERGAAIKYRPGGRYEKEAAEELLPGTHEEYKLNQLYQKYIDRCNDPTLDKSEILFDMDELEIFSMSNRRMTKEQLCAIITKYLRDVLKYRFDDKGL
jgi:hypothetical protein